MTRLLHPPELEHPRRPDRFDPVIEGARYRLSRELSLAIWERACADATDSAGRRDEAQARQRFHEVASRIAARGGRIGPDVGRVTRVSVELDGPTPDIWGADELKPRAPGRETLVAVEARRWAHLSGDPAVTFGDAEEAKRPATADQAMERTELSGADEVTRAMAALQLPARANEATPLEKPVRSRMNRLLDLFSPAGAVTSGRMISTSATLPSVVMRSAERTEIDPEAADLVTRACRGGMPLDDALRSQLETALATRLHEVRVHTDSEADAAASALGARAFAVNNDIFFRSGAYDPHDRDGQRLIAHEVAHTVQARAVSAPAHEATTVSEPDDAPEREADAFADAFVRGIEDGQDGSAASQVPGLPEHQTPPDFDRSAPTTTLGADPTVTPARSAGTGSTLREHAGSSILLHPAEKVLKFAAKWLAKRETKMVSKHIARHARGIAGRAIHSIFKQPRKIKVLIEGAVKEAAELTAKHAAKPAGEVIEEGAIRVVRQATGTPGKVRWIVQKTFKDAIGTKGERILRIIIDQSGRVVSAFPSDRLIVIGLGVGAVEILGERSAAAAEKARDNAERDAAKEDSFSLWELVPFIGDIWGGSLNEGEDEMLRRGREFEKDLQDLIAEIEAEERRTLSAEERANVEELFRAAIGGSLLNESDDGESE